MPIYLFLRMILHFLAIVAMTPAGFDTGPAEQPSPRSGGVAAADSSFSMAEGRIRTPSRDGNEVKRSDLSG